MINEPFAIMTNFMQRGVINSLSALRNLFQLIP